MPALGPVSGERRPRLQGEETSSDQTHTEPVTTLSFLSSTSPPSLSPSLFLPLSLSLLDRLCTLQSKWKRGSAAERGVRRGRAGEEDEQLRASIAFFFFFSFLGDILSRYLVSSCPHTTSSHHKHTPLRLLIYLKPPIMFYCSSITIITIIKVIIFPPTPPFITSAK